MATLLFLAAVILVAAIIWFIVGTDEGPRVRRIRSGGGSHEPVTDMEVAEELGAVDAFGEGGMAPVTAPRTEPPGADADEPMVVLVRNPRSVYVYWELDTAADRRVRNLLGPDEWQRTIPCLRVFDVTSGRYPDLRRGHVFELTLHERDDHAFINGLKPGRRYVISHDRKTPEGRYYMIRHSGPVQMPYDRPSSQSPLYRLYGGQPGHWSGSVQA